MSVAFVKQRMIRTLILAGIGLCVVALIALMSLLSSKSGDKTPAILNVAGVGGPWALTDQSGQPRSSKDFADRYKLIYFGFTSCPAICPTELQKTAAAYQELSERQQKRIQMIFVTVDPERDTPSVLKNYVALFDKSMIGLTGSLDEIETVKSAYKVYAQKAPGETPQDYMMDHSSFIYFMSPDDTLIALFKTTQTSGEIEDFLRNYLKKNDAAK